MKHQQVQLASKHNFIRLMALVAMLAVMVCGMILSINATDDAQIVTFAADTGITFDGQTNRWVKTYDGTDEIDSAKVTLTIGGNTVAVEAAKFGSKNANAETFITITYDGGKTLTVPAAIKPINLTWAGEGKVEVQYDFDNNTYVGQTVDMTGVDLNGLIDSDVSFSQPTVNFVVDGMQSTVAYAQVVLTGDNAGNYIVEPLKVNVTVKPIVIDTIVWEGAEGSFTYGDDLSGIKAYATLGNKKVYLVVTVTDSTADSCTLVATAPNGIYTVTAANTSKTITFNKKVYNVVLNNGEFLDNGDLLNAGLGYQLVVESAEGDIPTEILSQIVYKYYDANGNEVAKVTKPGVYTVKATMPTIPGVAFNANALEATLTIVRNYIIVSTPDGSIVIVGENGISNAVNATLTIPTEFARKALRGVKEYKGYTLLITGAEAGQKFTIYLPVSADLVANKNFQGITVDNLYLYDATEGTKTAANGTYTVSLSQDGAYYIVEGYTPAGEITLMLAPNYKVPFFSSAIGIAILILVALLILVVLPIFIGMKLVQIENSGRNPVIAVETVGNVPEIEPVIIPDLIEDPDAVIEESIEILADTLAEEVIPEETEYDVDATDAVAEAMDVLNAEVAEIDLGNADGALNDMVDQMALDLAEQVDAEADAADVSDEVLKAVAEAMAENFNESADATDAIALIEEEEVAPEVVEEPVAEEPVVEEVVVEEPVVEEVVAEEPVVEEPAVEEVAPVAAAEADDSEDDEDGSFGGFGSMPLDYIDAIAEAERYAEMLEQESRGEVQLVTRYRRSYLSRLAQSQGSIQDYYNAIKNLLLSYKGVKSRISWGFESFNVGRTPLAKFNAKTRTLYVYIALSPEELVDTKYNFTDMSEKKKYAAVPVLIKVKGERKFKHALELITKLCEEKLQLPKKKNFTETDYRTPFKTTEELVQEGTIKMMVAAIPVAASAVEEAVVEEVPAEETVLEEAVAEEVAEEATEEAVAEEVTEEATEEAVAEEVVEEATEEAVAEEVVEETTDDINENA